MAREQITEILCYDDHKALVNTGIFEDVRRRFSDSQRYKVLTFSNRDSFLEEIREKKNKAACRVTIFGIHDQEEHVEIINDLMIEVRQADTEAGLIILVSGDKAESIKQLLSINADAYIPKNDNAILRIHNAIKKMISVKNLALCLRRRNFSMVVLFGFLGLMLIFFLVSSLIFPDYF